MLVIVILMTYGLLISPLLKSYRSIVKSMVNQM